MSRLEWCARAEPKLLGLRDRLAAGSVSPAAAYVELLTLVGRKRFTADWTAAHKKPCPPNRAPSLWALEQWERAHPRTDPLHRVYENTSDCIAISLAAELGLEEFWGDLIGARHRKDGSVIPEEAR